MKATNRMKQLLFPIWIAERRSPNETLENYRL